MENIRINDMRGAKFSHSIEIKNNKALYNGQQIETLQQHEGQAGKHLYYIISYNMVLGTFALTDEDKKTVQTCIDIADIDLTRVSSDSN